MKKSKVFEALKSANEMCRSAMSIVEREGDKTNWPAFKNQLHESLELQHAVLNPMPKIRMDRKYRCGRCNELNDPMHWDHCWDSETGQPICPACEQFL